MNTTPSPRQRLVGTALRQAREAMGYTLGTSADTLGCDQSKISRIENGQRGIRTEEIKALLSEYGVTGPLAATLVWLAHPHRRKGWWQAFPDIVTANGLDYAVIEAAATHISIYQATHIPALLQTPDYALAVLAEHPQTAPEHADRTLEALLARQHAIIGDQERLIEVVLSESALRQQGGSETVMNAQTRHLTALTKQHPGLTLRVLPFSAGAHTGIWTGPMNILRFPPSPLGVVYRPGTWESTCLCEPDQLGQHLKAFTRLSNHALTPNESAQLIRSVQR